MELKRYTNKELTEVATEMFYDYLSDEENGELNITKVSKTYTDKIRLYENRVAMYHEALKNEEIDGNFASSLLKQLAYLEEGLYHLRRASMSYQKELYAKTHSTNFCRSILRIPLDKKINSFYDDLILEFVFYDDVCTPNGKTKEYNQLTSKEAREEFIKQNTEITHIGLVYAPNNQVKSVIAIKGNLNFTETRIEDCGITLLPSKFSDFKNLKLIDTFEIKNNDLKQFIQSKIDLDKENMKELSSILIRGDLYGIYLSPEEEYTKSVLYIRYICRSTGRVYYNRLNLSNLSLSPYFKKDDYDSYAKAWWNLNTLGGNPDGKPVIRC